MRGPGRQGLGVVKDAMARVPRIQVKVVVGLQGGAWMRRGVLYVARAANRAATQRRVERALVACIGPPLKA